MYGMFVAVIAPSTYGTFTLPFIKDAESNPFLVPIREDTPLFLCHSPAKTFMEQLILKSTHQVEYILIVHVVVHVLRTGDLCVPKKASQEFDLVGFIIRKIRYLRKFGV